MTRWIVATCACVLAFLSAGCPCKGSSCPGQADSGPGNLDTACQTLADAKANPNCQCSAGTQPVDLCSPTDPNAPQCAAGQPVPAGKSCGYLIQQLETNWWQINVTNPGQRPILTVEAEYCAPITQVDLSLIVYGSDGVSALPGGSVVAASGQPPPPAEAVVRLPGAGTYYVQVTADNSNGDNPVETHYPYRIVAFITPDPDPNEPNGDPSTATPMCQGWCQSGTCCTPTPDSTNTWTTTTGDISVSGDQDWFTLDVPNKWSHQVLFMHIHADALPPPATNLQQLEYTLWACPSPPAGSPNACGTPGGVVAVDGGSVSTYIAQAHAENPFGAEDLYNAVLVPPGRYAIQVDAYQAPGLPPPPGNPLFKFTVSAQLFQDLDPNDTGTTLNDTSATALPVTMSGSPPHASLKGRIEYTANANSLGSPDQDWYAINTNGYGRLHYKVSYTSGGTAQRYSVPSPNPQELRVTDQNLYLLSRRDEDSAVEGNNPLPMLPNFEGIVALPASAATVYVDFGFRGSTGADDREYQIDFDLLPQTPDEAAQTANGGVIPLSISGSGPSFSGSATAYIGYGVGFSQACYQGVIQDNQNTGNNNNPILSCYHTQSAAPNTVGSLVSWGANDCDPDPAGDCYSDQDVLNVSFPSNLPTTGGVDGGFPDFTLGLSWTIHPAPAEPWVGAEGAGGRAYDVVFDLPFGGQVCGGGNGGELGYTSQAGTPWCAASCGTGSCPNSVNTFTFDTSGGTSNFAVSGAACFCLQSSFVQQNLSGGFQVPVAGVNRAAWADSQVDVTLTLSPYPPAGNAADGGCPQVCGL